MKTINITRSEPSSDWPPADYYRYHYGISKSLIKCLQPHLRRGIDTIFIYSQPNIRSLAKKLDRFWHNYRKTVDKSTYNSVRMRTCIIVVSNYADSLAYIGRLEYWKPREQTLDFKRLISLEVKI